MLVKLLSNQIPRYEELIKKTILVSIPPCEEYGISLIYKELLMDYAQAWIYYTLAEDGDQDVKGMTITRIVDDVALGGRVLNVIAVHTLESVKEDAYLESYLAVKEFAKANDCNLMTFYTHNPKIIEMTKLLNIKHKTMFMIASFDDN